MTRTVVWSMALLTTLSGCGEPEQPRFAPATGREPGATSVERRAGGKSSGEVTIPKNIETH